MSWLDDIASFPGRVADYLSPQSMEQRYLDREAAAGRYINMAPRTHVMNDYHLQTNNVRLLPQNLHRLATSHDAHRVPELPRMIEVSRESYPGQWSTYEIAHMARVAANQPTPTPPPPEVVYVPTMRDASLRQWADEYGIVHSLPSAPQVGRYGHWGEGFAPSTSSIPSGVPVSLDALVELRDRMHSNYIQRGSFGPAGGPGIKTEGLDNLRQLTQQADVPFKRKRGRKKGSKNKPKLITE